MWIMTKYGYYSAVEHRDDPDLLLIRARSRKDLENLDLFARGNAVLGKIETTLTKADYPHRLIVTKVGWASIIGAMIGDVDYPNFKNAVARTNPRRANTYHDVWETLHQIEREPDAGVYAKKVTVKTVKTPPAVAAGKRGAKR